MHPFALSFLTLCSFFATFLVDASNNLNGFSINLFHRDSPMSPLYDSSKTLSELVRNAATRSISRSNKLDFTIGPNAPSPSPTLTPTLTPTPTPTPTPSSSSSSSAESTIVAISDLGEYLINFSIGTPPIERLAMFDTGLDLTWVQCSPCKSCFPQDTPLFDPTQSSTYMDVPCDSQPCTLFPPSQRDCGNSRECFYLKQHGEKSMTIGKLGSDSISFGSMGQGVTFPNSVFGCGMYNNFSFPISSKASGFLGLGAGPLSTVSQLGDQIGHKFSYCLVPFTSTATGKLKFGNQKTVLGNNGTVSTPLITNPSFPSFYFFNLEGITIGTKRVQTIQSINDNMIIDSVSILTRLEQTLYSDFISSVKEVINVEAVVRDVPSPFDFCLSGGANINFPDFVFHFTGGDLVLNKKNMFITLDNNMACMTVLPIRSNGISILGNWAQVDFLVEYDIGGKKVSFAPTDCSTN